MRKWLAHSRVLYQATLFRLKGSIFLPADFFMIKMLMIEEKERMPLSYEGGRSGISRETYI
jgi:hypothetical protein